jgi:hypothetical protein
MGDLLGLFGLRRARLALSTAYIEHFTAQAGLGVTTPRATLLGATLPDKSPGYVFQRFAAFNALPLSTLCRAVALLERN